MGYHKILWISERPIRQRLSIYHPHLIEAAVSGKSSQPVTDFQTKDDEQILFKSIGESLHLVGKQVYSTPYSLPFNNIDSVFNYVTSLHSTWESLLLWTGNRLVPLGADTFKHETTKLLFDLEKYSDNSFFTYELTPEQHQFIASNEKKWDRTLAMKGEYSIWLINDDVLRHSKSEQEIIKHGKDFLDLMLCNWYKHSHDNFITRVCTLTGPQFGFFAWGRNTLWKLSQVNADLLLEHLKKI